MTIEKMLQGLHEMAAHQTALAPKRKAKARK